MPTLHTNIAETIWGRASALASAIARTIFVQTSSPHNVRGGQHSQIILYNAPQNFLPSSQSQIERTSNGENQHFLPTPHYVILLVMFLPSPHGVPGCSPRVQVRKHTSTVMFQLYIYDIQEQALQKKTTIVVTPRLVSIDVQWQYFIQRFTRHPTNCEHRQRVVFGRKSLREQHANNTPGVARFSRTSGPGIVKLDFPPIRQTFADIS